MYGSVIDAHHDSVTRSTRKYRIPELLDLTCSSGSAAVVAKFTCFILYLSANVPRHKHLKTARFLMLSFMCYIQ